MESDGSFTFGSAGDRLRGCLVSASTRESDSTAAGRELALSLAHVDAVAIVFFTSPAIDGCEVASQITRQFPHAHVIGCTTAGEFTERGTGTGGACAVAIPAEVAPRCGSALANLEHDIDAGTYEAVRTIEAQLGLPLRQADPDRYIGIILIDGLHGDEERVNEILGNVAPLMSFVGGSAGDDLNFDETTVFYQTTASSHGAALLVLETAAPFAVVKTCSFLPTGTTFTITEADVSTRTVMRLNGRPAAEVYAEAVGSSVDALDSNIFMSHPVGLMFDGIPWIRSPQQVVDGGGIRFYCQILPGMRVDLMRSTNLVDDTAVAFQDAVAQLGGQASGAVMFNCILRRLEIDANGWEDAFIRSLGGIPGVGFHTYGKSWLGHINQTLTAVVFGDPHAQDRLPAR